MYNGNDRVKQVNEIDKVAQDLTSQPVTLADYNGDTEAFTKDVVDYWLSEVELPAWWNDHDTGLLKERVREHAS